MPFSSADPHPENDIRNDRSGDRDVFLSDPHSRRIIEYLRQTDGPVDVSTLAAQVAADLTGQPPEDVPKNVHRRVQTWFRHGQLPELDKHGVIEYDPDRETVEMASEESRDRPTDGSFDTR